MKTTKKISTVGLGLLLLLALNGCKSTSETSSNGKTDLESYYDHNRVVTLIEVEGTETTQAEVSLKGKTVKISAPMAPLQAPTTSNDVLKSAISDITGLGKWGLGAWVLKDNIGDKNTYHTTNNNAP